MKKKKLLCQNGLKFTVSFGKDFQVIDQGYCKPHDAYGIRSKTLPVASLEIRLYLYFTYVFFKEIRLKFTYNNSRIFHQIDPLPHFTKRISCRNLWE